MKNDFRQIGSGALLLALTILFFASCGDSGNGGEEKIKKVTVICDDAIIGFMLPLLEKHDSSVKEIDYEFTYDNSFKCMTNLLSNNIDAAIISRDFSDVEKEQFATRNIELKKRKAFAYDLLVFFVEKNSGLDTLNAEQITDLLVNNANIKDYFPSLGSEPVIASRNQYSSELENLKVLVAKNKKIQRPLKVFGGIDSLKDFVADNNAIGAAYLSQVQNDDRFKLLKIGFTDSTGRRIKPQLVDRTTLIRNMYPYRVTHFVYLYEKNNSPADKFYRFLTINNLSAKYFVEAGVIPAYTKTFILKQEEE